MNPKYGYLHKKFSWNNSSKKTLEFLFLWEIQFKAKRFQSMVILH